MARIVVYGAEALRRDPDRILTFFKQNLNSGIFCHVPLGFGTRRSTEKMTAVIWGLMYMLWRPYGAIQTVFWLFVSRKSEFGHFLICSFELWDWKLVSQNERRNLRIDVYAMEALRRHPGHILTVCFKKIWIRALFGMFLWALGLGAGEQKWAP